MSFDGDPLAGKVRRVHRKAFHARIQREPPDCSSVTGVEGSAVGKYREGDVAEGLFGAFLAFMTVMAISTVFTSGLSTVTAVSSFSGGVGLVSLLYHAYPKNKKRER